MIVDHAGGADADAEERQGAQGQQVEREFDCECDRGVSCCPGALGVAQEVVQDARLVHVDVRELAHAGGVIGGAGVALDIGGVLRIRGPEAHLDVAVGLFDNLVGESEGLEGLHRTGLDAVGLADVKAARTQLDGAGVDARETGKLCGDHCGGRTGADNQHIHLIRDFGGTVNAIAFGRLDAWISGDVAPVVNLHYLAPLRCRTNIFVSIFATRL